jgi:hypothetical protein
VEYIVRAHNMEANPSLISAGQMKRAIHTCKNLVLTIVKTKEPDKSNALDALNPLHKNEMLEMRQVFQWGGRQKRAFDTLGEKINPTPILALPDLQQPFKVATSTSADAMRADILFRPPSFASIVLKNVHVSYVGKYAIDEVFKDVFERLIHGLQVKIFWLQDKLFYHLGKPCIPTIVKMHVIGEAYTSLVFGNFGVERIVMYLLRLCFPRMNVIVTMNVKGCVLCIFKPTNRKLGLYTPLPVPSHPWKSISLDFVGGFPMSKMGHDYFHVVVDRFSKTCVLMLCKKKITVERNCSPFLSACMGPLWTSHIHYLGSRHSIPWKVLWRMMDTKLKRSISFHPQTDRSDRGC